MPKIDRNGIGVAVTQTVTFQQITDAMCSAFEAGSAYWCNGAVRGFIGSTPAKGMTFPDAENPSYPWYAQVGFWSHPEFRVTLEYFDGDEPEKVTITPKELAEGVQLMADKSPKHFADLVGSDGGDSATGDVLFQYVALKEIVFG